MFIAMNRFKVQNGSESDFEAVWKNRDSSLKELPGFITFHLLRGAKNEAENYTLYSSHTTWQSEQHFLAWTKSEQFRNAHKNAGQNKVLYIGPPKFEGFTVVEGA